MIECREVEGCTCHSWKLIRTNDFFTEKWSKTTVFNPKEGKNNKENTRNPRESPTQTTCSGAGTDSREAPGKRKFL